MTFFGLTLESELDKAGHKPSKQERKIEAARQRVLDQYLSEEQEGQSQGFADPALMF